MSLDRALVFVIIGHTSLLSISVVLFMRIVLEIAQNLLDMNHLRT